MRPKKKPKPKITKCELIQWAAKKCCENPKEEYGARYEVAWGEKRQDVVRTSCRKCIPCKAKLIIGLELKIEMFTR
jgi:hypothetical protein